MKNDTTKRTLHTIFPSSVWIEDLDYQLSKEERNFLLTLDRRPNSHNETSCNSYVLDNKLFDSLREVFLSSVQDFINLVYNPDETITPYITQSWVNYTEKGGGHGLHYHPNSLISGVFYLQVDHEVDRIIFEKTNSPALFLATQNPTPFSCNNTGFSVKNNQLILFESHLKHAIGVVTSSQTRISLSFNTFVKGNLGFEGDLTRLSLR